jgi:hypothetical protein
MNLFDFSILFDIKGEKARACNNFIFEEISEEFSLKIIYEYYFFIGKTLRI